MNPDVLSIIADFSAVVISIAALVISLLIAVRQNKISLFDKRIEVYRELNRLLRVGRNLDASSNPQFEEIMTTYVIPIMGYSIEKSLSAQFLDETDATLSQIPFLFHKLTPDQIEAFAALTTTFYHLLSDSKTPFPDLCNKFLDACRVIGNPVHLRKSSELPGVIASVEQELQLSKHKLFI